MAVEGIRNLTQNLAEQLREQIQNPQANANTPDTGNPGNVAVTEDTFTPSTQSNSAQATAQEAGIFQISQGASAVVTANILFEQTTPYTEQNAFPARDASAKNHEHKQCATDRGAQLKRAGTPGATLRARARGAGAASQRGSRNECAGASSGP